LFPLIFLRERAKGWAQVKIVMKKKVIDTATKACRELRRRATRSEQSFWYAVRNRKISGKKFLRQFPIFFKYMDKETFFIADFYCHENRLVVEIDGRNHDQQKEYDKLRTYIINRLNIEVIRFRNEEVETDINGVLDKRRAVLSNGTHPKSLS
jgi:very-short-patch-repair endonuclease